VKRLNFEEHAILTEVIGGRGHRHFQDHHSLSIFNDTLITFCLSFLLFLFPHRQVTIESDPKIGELPTFGSLAKPSWIFFENVVPLSLSLSLSLPSSSPFLSFLLFLFLSFSFSFFLSFPLFLYPHRQVTIESGPNVGRLPTLGSLAKPSWTGLDCVLKTQYPFLFLSLFPSPPPSLSSLPFSFSFFISLSVSFFHSLSFFPLTVRSRLRVIPTWKSCRVSGLHSRFPQFFFCLDAILKVESNL